MFSLAFHRYKLLGKMTIVIITSNIEDCTIIVQSFKRLRKMLVFDIYREGAKMYASSSFFENLITHPLDGGLCLYLAGLKG